MKKIIIPNQNLQTKVDAFENRVVGAGGVVLDKNRMLKTMVDFEDASILFCPNAYRSGRLHNQIPNTTAGDFTFNRNSQAGIINSSGNYELVANNIPRLDWKTGKPGLLNESQSTNLCFPSDVAVTQDIATINIDNIPYQLHFVGTGSVTVSGSGTGTLNGTGVNDRVYLTITCATGTATITPSGDVREIQFERSRNASSYIPTTVSAVTRLAEDTRVTGPSGLIGQTSGSLYCEFELTQDWLLKTTRKTFIVIASPSTSAFFTLGLGKIEEDAITRIFIGQRNLNSAGNILNGNVSAPTISLGYHKVIVTYTNLATAISFKIFHNGELVQSLNTGEIITESLSVFRVGGESVFFQGANDRIFKAAHWNYALTESKSKRLTEIL